MIAFAMFLIAGCAIIVLSVLGLWLCFCLLRLSLDLIQFVLRLWLGQEAPKELELSEEEHDEMIKQALAESAKLQAELAKAKSAPPKR